MLIDQLTRLFIALQQQYKNLKAPHEAGLSS